MWGGDGRVLGRGVSGHSFSKRQPRQKSLCLMEPQTRDGRAGGGAPALCLRAVAMAARAAWAGPCGLCLGPVAMAALVCFDVTMCWISDEFLTARRSCPAGTLLSLLLPRQRLPARRAPAPARPAEILISPASACTAGTSPTDGSPPPRPLPSCLRARGQAQVERPGPRGRGAVGVPAAASLGHTRTCLLGALGSWRDTGPEPEPVREKLAGGSLGPVCRQPAPFLPHTPCPCQDTVGTVSGRELGQRTRAFSLERRRRPPPSSTPRRGPPGQRGGGVGVPTGGAARAGRALCHDVCDNGRDRANPHPRRICPGPPPPGAFPALGSSRQARGAFRVSGEVRAAVWPRCPLWGPLMLPEAV